MIGRIDVRFRCVDLIEAGNSDRRKDRLHDEPRPGVGKPVQPPSAAVENATRQRQQSQDNRVQPYERIEDQV